MRKVYYIKQTPSGRVFDAVNGIVIALLMFLMIYPFWNMLILSFNDGTDALLGKLYFWPRVWTLSNYEYVFKNRDLLHGALVQFFVNLGRRRLLADHLRVMLLIALNQTLFLLDIGDTHLHSLQKKMDISRCIAAAPDSVQSGDKIIHLP